MGLFDNFGGDTSGGLYGSMFDPQQQQRLLQQRALQGFLGGMQKSGALDYTAPFLSGKVPAGFAAGLAGGAAGAAEAQDKGISNALNAQLVGLKGQELQANLGLMRSQMGAYGKLFDQNGGVPSSQST